MVETRALGHMLVPIEVHLQKKKHDMSGCSRFPFEICMILEHMRFRVGIAIISRIARFIESL